MDCCYPSSCIILMLQTIPCFYFYPLISVSWPPPHPWHNWYLQNSFGVFALHELLTGPRSKKRKSAYSKKDLILKNNACVVSRSVLQASSDIFFYLLRWKKFRHVDGCLLTLGVLHAIPLTDHATCAAQRKWEGHVAWQTCEVSSNHRSVGPLIYRQVAIWTLKSMMSRTG